MKATSRFLAGFALALGASCSAPPPPWAVDEIPVAGPYETLDGQSRKEFQRALEMFQSGRRGEARTALKALAEREPEDIRVAIWLQEVRLACKADSSIPREKEFEERGENLRDVYRKKADENPRPEALVLAARIEDDGPAAELLLERALELDPAMSWAHYGLAFVAARAGDLAEVTRRLESTFQLEPGHLPALRLYAWALAQTGDSKKAAAAFEAWLENADRDLLATKRTRSLVMLDLALVYLADDQPRRAQELIETLPPGSVEEVRRLAALAAAEEARGWPEQARETAAAALLEDSDALLPAVQEALLLELWLHDVEGARRAWRRVLEISAGRDDLAAGMQRFRAQLHLQRLREKPEGDLP